MSMKQDIKLKRLESQVAYHLIWKKLGAGSFSTQQRQSPQLRPVFTWFYLCPQTCACRVANGYNSPTVNYPTVLTLDFVVCKEDRVREKASFTSPQLTFTNSSLANA